MDTLFVLFLLSLSIAGYVSWNIGANDVANAMGTSVGSKTLSLRQAILIAAIFEFCGAYFFGSYVSETLQTGIIDTSYLSSTSLILGMLSSLFAAGILLQFASFLGLPVSTTHSIVGAIVGFGCVAGGIDAIYWENVFSIATSWIVSPLLGGVVAFFVFRFIRKTILSTAAPLEEAKKHFPWFTALVAFFLSLVYLTKKEDVLFIPFLEALGISILVYFLSYFVSKRFISISRKEFAYSEEMKALLQLQEKRRNAGSKDELFSLDREIIQLSEKIQNEIVFQHEKKQFKRLEMIFGILQVITACMMAFSHGANDVANAIGPIQAILSMLSKEGLGIAGAIHPYALALGGFGIVLGLATWGWRVMETVGKNITELTPSRGFSAEIGASMVILLASRLGFPISTTHTLVGAVLGVGFAGGIASINIKTTRDIFVSWIVTIPLGAILSIIIYELFHYCFF